MDGAGSGRSHDRRWIALQGADNVRDMGGLPTIDGRWVRSGRLFRSDNLDNCTPEDIELLRDKVGLARVIDLRSEHRQESLPVDGIERINIPLPQDLRAIETFGGDPAAFLVGLYVAYVDKVGAQVGQVVRTVAEHCHEPMLFHCTAGKDRTGLIAAILHLLLGVSPQTAVEDYALTDSRMPRIAERLRRTSSVLEGVDPEVLRARPNTMQSVLDNLVGRYGSVENWAGVRGLEQYELERLRSELVLAGPD